MVFSMLLARLANFQLLAGQQHGRTVPLADIHGAYEPLAQTLPHIPFPGDCRWIQGARGELIDARDL
jgi:hypothetical protein